MYRLKRLPDIPNKIALGVFIGVFISFTPFWGLHFGLAVLLAVVVRANVLASVLACFIGNPITFPIITIASLKLGGYILGGDTEYNQIIQAVNIFTHMLSELAINIKNLSNNADTSWEYWHIFSRKILPPYLLGSTILGLFFGLLFYYLTHSIVTTYHKQRKKKQRISKGIVKNKMPFPRKQNENHI